MDDEGEGSAGESSASSGYRQNRSSATDTLLPVGVEAPKAGLRCCHVSAYDCIQLTAFTRCLTTSNALVCLFL